MGHEHHPERWQVPKCFASPMPHQEFQALLHVQAASPHHSRDVPGPRLSYLQ